MGREFRDGDGVLDAGDSRVQRQSVAWLLATCEGCVLVLCVVTLKLKGQEIIYNMDIA